MSSSKLMFSLIGSSLLRNHSALNPLPSVLPLRFLSATPSPLRFSRNCSSSAALSSGGAEVSALPPLVNHPWPEWVNFVDRLKSKGYLSPDLDTTDGLLKQACLKFARDRFDIFKSLSAQDLQTIVEKGCPSIYRKVVNSGKRLRAHLQLDEGEVCGSCNLRGSCDRAYVILDDSEASARTVDIVRILLLYASDPVVISGGSKPPGLEDIEASARKLLSELIELSETTPDPELPKTSLPKPVAKAPRQRKFLDDTDDRSYQNVEMKKGDWMCSECDFLNFARNIQCLKCSAEGPKRVGNHIEMKKGDWECQQCNFLNFERNIRCLKCSAEGPKRVEDDIEMRKGDWKCPQCEVINFASRMKCFRCSEQRPKMQLNPGEWERPAGLKRVENGIEMKKGDWTCPRCEVINFASRTKCFRCNEQGPIRQLNPGEWECPSCDFLNYTRNTSCKKCNHDRPKDVDMGYGQETWKKPFSNKI